MEGITIRPVEASDREALFRLLCGIENFTGEEVSVAMELIDASLRDPDGSGYEVLVAEAEGKIVGYVCFGPTPLTEATYDLYWIAVAPDFRGQGVGRRLHEAMLQKIREMRGRLIRIETSSKDSYEKTVRFYKALGYKEVSRIKDFYRVGDDLLTFILQID